MKMVRYVFLVLFYAMSWTSFSQQQAMKFKHLDTRDGLSQDHVNAIFKDYRGFMWFATDEGLNKYDGYRFIAYKYDPQQPTTISNNYVYDVLEDQDSTLWVATASGLDKFNRAKDTFTHYSPHGKNIFVRDIFVDSKKRMWIGTTEGLYLFNVHDGTFKRSVYNELYAGNLNNNFIYRIAEDNQGELWIATKDGLNRFDPESSWFTRYAHDPSNDRSIGINWIKSVYSDSRGNIWVGTQGGGVALFNRKENDFTNFRHDPDNNKTVGHNDILSFAEGNDGRLWVGTENGGISVFDYATFTFTSYRNDLADNSSISNNSIYSLYRDDIGNMWVGTWSGGVNFLPRFGEKFIQYTQVPGNPNSLSNNIVLFITGDQNGMIWIGTDGGGLNRFDPKTRTFTHYRHDPHQKNSPGSDYVLSVVAIEKDVLALGYHRAGFDLFNTKTGTFIHHTPREYDANSPSELSINTMVKDRDGNLWLGTWGGGVGMYNLTQRKFTWYRQNAPGKNRIHNNFIHSVAMDKYDNLWIGTDVGLDVLNKKTGQFSHYQNDVRDKKSLSHNVVVTMINDHTGNLWLASAEGLNMFDHKTKTFKAYTEKDGLPNNMIRSILEDHHGNLWISSNKGLSKFDPVTKVFKNYSIADGLQGNEFKAHASYRTMNGEMYFGGTNGFNVFYPDSLKDNTFIPPVYITDFQVFNSSIVVNGPDSLLHHHISETKEITLPYDQSVFTFEFSALNYTLPEKNLYAYTLKGFDKQWNYVNHKRTATYTNLDPGTYVFHVKASNNDGVWNEKGTAITIIITPPFWLTWWFRILSVIMVAGGLVMFYLIRMGTVRRQKYELEKQVKERTARLEISTREERNAREEAEKARQEAEQANRTKSIFLATMSHEIRTPMNGVIGMASLLAETPLNDEQVEYTETIRSCGENLLGVINDILDFSKIESGKMEIEEKDFDLRSCIEEVLDVFAGKAAATGLDLIYQMDNDVPAQIIGDELRLRQVLMNLVGNAAKFTHEGEIFVGVHLRGKEGELMTLCFEVRDTGIGIPKEKLDKLFKAFSQVDSSTTRKYGGTGLGLAISEKLVELMGGHIWIDSTVGEGTVFSFTIRTRISENPVQTYVYYNMGGLEGKKVLVIDDNSTNRRILKNQLELWKLVPSLADSGVQALEILSQSPRFDLVLTDMQMPGMDGVRVTQSIRELHPQLPVILLSSVGDERIKQHPGLFSSILTKPVKQSMLCKNILAELRKTDKSVAQEQKVKQKLHTDFARRYALRILVVEDNPVNQKLAARVLSKLGYVPDAAWNGLEAVQAVNKVHYDVLLMDMQMPEMDGLEATRKIRSSTGIQQPVIIAMTANAMQGDRDQCLQAGMDDYISKPIDLEELVGLLEKWAGSLNRG
jgi:signal transduction histidine kinase/ligand-binding sensor domain-containing protein/DNA-binding response OmpR family regulator